LAGNRKQRHSKTLLFNLTNNLSESLITKQFTLNRFEEETTPTVEIRCPKCSSPAVEKNKNQEYHCSHCGEIFYFVTPNCGSQSDLERYKL
jgi:DNA-directed RNA polymerase subunit RPC12/RpoP